LPGTPTTRLALPTIDSTADSVSSFPTVNTAQMSTLDNAVTFSSGTLAARPAAGLRGRVYYASDVPAYYLDNATSWLTLEAVVDTGWVPLTLASGVTSSGGFTPSARLRGDMVELKGGLWNQTGSSDAGTLATLPTAVTPPAHAVWEPVTQEANSGVLNLRITNSGGGQIQIPSGLPSGETASLNGISYSPS
jgi:hypothetical protein